MAAALEVDRLSVAYRTGRGTVHAVDDVSFTLAPGQTLGLVGESGCGKSSLAQAVVRLVEPASGRLSVDGVELTGLSGRALRARRHLIQMVFQDPAASMNPRHRIGTVVGEPLTLLPGLTPDGRRERVRALLAGVGLPAEVAARFPHELSGGQKQRVAIARALALEPRVLVCDEAVSALDVSLQAQVLNLLVRLQEEKGVAYLFISHDLSVVQHMADRIAVMYLGRIAEIGPRRSLWRQPAHPYTRSLIDAVPMPAAGATRIEDKPVLAGDLPSPYDPPPGCRFHTRCPLAVERCRHERPELRPVGPDHLAACHLVSPP